MAKGTLASLGIPVAAMKAPFGLDVSCDVFVASEAKFALLCALKLDVAVAALALDIGMSLDHFTRHDERFKLRIGCGVSEKT